VGGDKVIILTKGEKQICKITLKKNDTFMSKLLKWDPKKHGYILRFEFDVNIFRNNLESFFKNFFECIGKKLMQSNELNSLIPPDKLADYELLKTVNVLNMTADDRCLKMIKEDANIFWGSYGDKLINKMTRKILFLDEQGNVMDAYKTCTITFSLTEDKNGTFTEVKVVELNKMDTFNRPCGVELKEWTGEKESQYLSRYEYNKNSSLSSPGVINIWLKIEEVLKKISASNSVLKAYLEKNQITITEPPSEMTTQPTDQQPTDQQSTDQQPTDQQQQLIEP
jgi:hypothetical protein